MKLNAAAGLEFRSCRSSEGMPVFEPKSRRRLCAEFVDVDIEFLSSLVARSNKVGP